MSELLLGILIGAVTTLVLASGIPIAFGLGAVAISFLVIFEGAGSLEIIAETFFAGLDNFTLSSIPMFILMGAVVASSRAAGDLYEAMERWLYKIPAGLIVANLGACAVFAALSGSSPATCAAIGKMGIPEMRRRGYPAGLASGAIGAGGTLGILIPPSLTMILYGIQTETSIGRLFLAGVLPGLLLTSLFMCWSIFYCWHKGYQFASKDRYSWREKFSCLPKTLPFLAIVVAVLYLLYGGVATPSEAAGAGALLCLIVAAGIYKIWRAADLWPILRDTTRDSVMILMIIATSILFSYMLSRLYVTQSLALWIAAQQFHPWVLMLWVNLLLLVVGFFLPPAAVILMTTPILLPIITSAGFDPVWFAVIMTINMEIGLITPPVGLNLYVIHGIAPDIRLATILWGALPFMLAMVLGIIILCIFPSLATWLPDAVMGVAR
ncbi:MAG: TRAP transporter large permease [Acidobacteria bacterium]|nr:TRAP transporter large permease [Acidobacteriota bacterium]